jgi:hypothetical protein
VGVQDTASFGVSVRLETLPGSGDDDEKEGGGGLFGGLLGGKKKEKKEEAKVEAGAEGAAWVKQTTVYPRKSTVPSKPKTVAFNYDKVTLFPISPAPLSLCSLLTPSTTTMWRLSPLPCLSLPAHLSYHMPLPPLRSFHLISLAQHPVPNSLPLPQDILCKIEYDDESAALLPAGTETTLGVFNITGIAALAKESAAKGLGAPKVGLFILHVQLAWTEPPDWCLLEPFQRPD